MARAFFATRHTAADVQEALCLNLLASALRVWEVGVTTINNDISFLEVRQKLLNESIDRLSSETNSSTEWAPTTLVPLASFARKSSTLLVVRLYAATVKPLSFMFKIRF